ncbi:MAG: hypothetical protein ACRCSB_01935, partial [Bacteroidales bacterium]
MPKKTKQYAEAELIKIFGLNRLIGDDILPLLKDWLQAETTLNAAEQYIFDYIYKDAVKNSVGWQEEDLKMNFIAFILMLGDIKNGEKYKSYFEQSIEADINGTFLKTKTDFMIAKGILEIPETPYFHFQEYKKQRDPSGDPMAQLIEAFLIAQEKNKNGKPIYGCEVTGAIWRFVVMKDKDYAISQIFDSTDRAGLLKIIAILRK